MTTARLFMRSSLLCYEQPSKRPFLLSAVRAAKSPPSMYVMNSRRLEPHRRGRVTRAEFEATAPV